MNEAQCYLRCYGARSGLVQVVSTVKAAPAGDELWYWARPLRVSVTGEELRRQFARRLADRREAA